MFPMTHAAQYALLCTLVGIFILFVTAKNYFPTSHKRKDSRSEHQKGDRHE